MSLEDLLQFTWLALDTSLTLLVLRRLYGRLDGHGTRATKLEERMGNMEQLQRLSLAELRNISVQVAQLATAREIDQAVESAFARRISPRREEPAATHFHGPVTSAGPLVGGDVGRIEE